VRDPVRYILAYALPHRGFATSGDRHLTRRFTGESDSLHTQWVVIDLNWEKPVNAVRIAWASPYATTTQVEYWTGTRALDFDAGPQGQWNVFPSGHFKEAKGGSVTLKLADRPVSARYLRILMTESSNTCDEHGSSDLRNCLGYAIQHQSVHHCPSRKTDRQNGVAPATCSCPERVQSSERGCIPRGATHGSFLLDSGKHF
jgi:F5/8 type C domain